MPLLNGDAPDGHVAKRRRLSDPERPRQRTTLFAPYRTVGLVSPTAVPFTAIALGKTTFQITTSTGRSLQTYDLRRGLNLVFLTRPQTPGFITATASRGLNVYAAWTQEDAPVEERVKGISVFKAGKRIQELPIPEHLDEDIVQLHTFGSWIIACCATRIEVWKETGEHHASLFPSRVELSILTGGVCSLPTFTNKILAGREDGTVEIWNVNTAKLIYTIEPPSIEAGAVTALQPAPVLGVAAIAYMSGLVNVHDVQKDELILSLNAGSDGQAPVTSISFRTDGKGAGSDGQVAGVMATASYNNGDVVLWDLNEGGRRAGTLRDAHAKPTAERDFNDGGVSKVEFLPGQSVLVTSGLDNALKTWIFDDVAFSPIPRPLHDRRGHASPITRLDFLPVETEDSDAMGKWLMASSMDRSFWSWSLRRDGQSAELSQGKNAVKVYRANKTIQSGPPSDIRAPEISCMACCLNRDGGMGALPGVRTLWASAKQLKGTSTATEQNVTGWESIVTGHKGEKVARTWFWGRKRAGRWIFETHDGAEVTVGLLEACPNGQSVAISPCGTFALVGSASGGIDMFNLQSGLFRQRFPSPITKTQARNAINAKPVADGQVAWPRGFGRHTAAITGLHVDNVNRTVISTGLDGKIKFWEFHTGNLLFQLDWSESLAVQKLTCFRANDLIALACSDFKVRVLDASTRRVIRVLQGCTEPISDLCFSNDGRWVVASAGPVVRIWDLPTSHLIEAIGLTSRCNAISFSPTGEYLAVARQDSIGIDIWTNSTLFTRTPTRIVESDDIVFLEGPNAAGEGGTNILALANEGVEAVDNDAKSSVAQLSKDIFTLSLVPKSRWQTLLHLDLIRERNKPKDPPKAPEKAPFFLGAAITGKQEHLLEEDLESERSRLVKFSAYGADAKFSRLLRTGEHAAALDHLKDLTPSAADVEIRSLEPIAPYTEMVDFVGALSQRLESRRDYELVQAWMAVFLKCHSEVLSEALVTSDGDALRRALESWRQSQNHAGMRLNSLVDYCAGVLGFLRSA